MMTMEKILYLAVSLLICCMPLHAENMQKSNITLSSPDNNLKFCFSQKEDNGIFTMYYEILYKNESIIQPSIMGLEMDNRVWESALAYTPKVDKVNSWNDNLIYKDAKFDQHNSTWTPLYGERSQIKDHYNSVVISLEKPDRSNYKMNIEVRAYNEGIAFRYTFPMHPDAVYNKITADLTDYTLPENAKTWNAKWAQGDYKQMTLSEWEDNIPYERPLTIQLPSGKWACLTDAEVSNWTFLNFVKSKHKANTISTTMYESMDMLTPYSTPWKVIMAADSPGRLLENNDIILNLNEPNKIANTDWIKPGKIMRETTLTTENAIACIDFCEKHNMQYILFDWKWYGPAFDYSSDASKVVAPIDMKKVVEYGKEKGVGVWLYVNHHALEKQAEKIFPIYKEWGIAGIKFGFVQFKTHRWATWVHNLVRLAADNNLMVNIHDEFRPSGFSRTYPNLLTQEGIRGNEEFPEATHNTILPFTRMISGAGDYTVCYFDPRIKNTHAHQLAFPIIYYSPLQTLYWYDTPARIENVPELEFFDNVPVTFDDTRVIHDSIGQYITIARRSGHDWFLGTIGNNESHKISTSLSFLDNSTKYVASIYTDNDKVNTKTKVQITKLIVTKENILQFTLKPKGGCTIHFTPASNDDLKKYKAYNKRQVL